jgi:hypothetical protein
MEPGQPAVIPVGRNLSSPARVFAASASSWSRSRRRTRTRRPRAKRATNPASIHYVDFRVMRIRGATGLCRARFHDDRVGIILDV